MSASETPDRSAPSVSVLMPVYNGAGFFEEAAGSILCQSLHDIELIIVDDGSTDDIPRKLEALAMSDARVIVHRQANTGISGALEAGRKLVRAPFIARMDSDDIALPNRLEQQLSFLRAHPTCVVVGGQVEIVNPNGKVLRHGAFPRHPSECHAHLAYGSPLCHPAVMMRADAVATCGGYRTLFEPAEDFDLWLRLSRLGALANLPHVVLRYRVHPDSVTNKRAMQNASAAALALVAHVSGVTPTQSNGTLLADQPWATIEKELPAPIRDFARTAHYRALISNGGIVYGDLPADLIQDLPRLADRMTAERQADVLAFMVTRAALQLGRRRRWGDAMTIAGIGLRHAPGAIGTDLARSIFRRTRRASGADDGFSPTVSRGRGIA